MKTRSSVGTFVLALPMLSFAAFPTHLTVVDQRGNPVPDVYVAGYKLFDRKHSLHVWTDENGNADVDPQKWGRAVGMFLAKPGYYEVGGIDPILDRPDHATLKILSPVRSVTMQSIRFPERFCRNIPMTPTALDLVECNWATEENGLHADVFVHGEIQRFENGDLEHRIVFDFPNPGDGMYLHDYSVETGFLKPVGPTPVTHVDQNLFTNHFVFVERCNSELDEYAERFRIFPSNIVPLSSDGTMPSMENPAKGGVFKIRTGLDGENDSAVYVFLPSIYTLGAARESTGGTRVELLSPQMYYKKFENSGLASFEGNWCQRDLDLSIKDYKSPPWGITGGSSSNGESNTNETANVPESGSVVVPSFSINSLGMVLGDIPDEGVSLGVYEIRNREFLAFDPSYGRKIATLPVSMRGMDFPAVNVTASEAESFCNWLTAREHAAGDLPQNEEYRLPTSREWLLGLAAGWESGLPETFEEALSTGIANLCDKSYFSEFGRFGGDYSDVPDDAFAAFAPVGSFPANKLGLFDLIGNAAEICREPSGTYSCLGESWACLTPSDARVSEARNGYRESLSFPDVGFRVVRAPVSSTSVTNASLSAATPWETPSFAFLGSFTNLATALRMVPVPSGAVSGVVETCDEEGGLNREEVSLSTRSAFYIGSCEVTQALYEGIMGTNPCETVQTDLPVDFVSWFDAVDFCARLTAAGHSVSNGIPQNWAFRLPTETEWEVACRTNQNFGVAIGASDETAWFSENSYGVLHPVGMKSPNEFGVFDMLGNVGEWCSDWHRDSYPRFAGIDDGGPFYGTMKVCRGGSASASADICTSARRFAVSPESRFAQLGFRIVLAPID